MMAVGRTPLQWHIILRDGGVGSREIVPEETNPPVIPLLWNRDPQSEYVNNGEAQLPSTSKLETNDKRWTEQPIINP
jgi:hypothetical protein